MRSVQRAVVAQPQKKKPHRCGENDTCTLGNLQFDVKKARKIASRYLTERKHVRREWLVDGCYAQDPADGLSKPIIIVTLYNGDYRKICIDGHAAIRSAIGSGTSLTIVTLSFNDSLRTFTGPNAGRTDSNMRRMMRFAMKQCTSCVEGGGDIAGDVGGGSAGRLWDF